MGLYSLWYQAVARIIDLEAPDVYHCPDFHAAMAVMYVGRPLPVLVVLHSAGYQGTIATQSMGRLESGHPESFRSFCKPHQEGDFVQG